MVEEKLKKAEKFKNYIWKYPKEKIDSKFVQKVVKLIDMSETELMDRRNHCELMLNNKSKDNPGRYLVLKEIENQINYCGVELFIRHLQSIECSPKYNRHRLLMEIRTFISTNKEVFKEAGEEFDPKKYTISEMFDSIPSEFTALSLYDILNGSLDYLGKFNRNHLTNTFIYKQGIWLTKDELNEFTILKTDGSLSDRIELIRDRLMINPKIDLHINPKGLTFDQLRSALNLKSGKKYSDLTSSQLETLRYKLLPLLEKTVQFHINQWEEKIKQIDEVLEFKMFG